MIWTTWRQHRSAAAVGAVVVALIAVTMVRVGSIARQRAHSLGLPACLRAHRDCSNLLDTLHGYFHSIPPFTGALIALPLLAGMFWAAPLVSREYEAGTHRLAWTQTVSPLRWITTKIGLIFGVVAAAALGIGLLADWTLDPLTPAFGGRYNSTWYDIQGVVPVACMLFALAAGVAASAVIRRTIPAMAVTLVAYAAARIPVHWVRAYFAPATTRSFATPLATLLQVPGGSPRDLVASRVPVGAWLQSATLTDPAGHAVRANSVNLDLLNRYCSNLVPTGAPTGTRGGPPATGVKNPGACLPHLQGLSLHMKISYQPVSHFWWIQSVESAIFLVAAAALVTIAVLAVTRRRPT
jgi:hypothetical protein